MSNACDRGVEGMEMILTCSTTPTSQKDREARCQRSRAERPASRARPRPSAAVPRADRARLAACARARARPRSEAAPVRRSLPCRESRSTPVFKKGAGGEKHFCGKHLEMTVHTDACDGVAPRARSVVTETRVTSVLNFAGMPIYEYDCRDGRRVVSMLILRPSVAAAPTWPRCGGTALSRVMSRFATVKSEEARLESLADPSSLGDLDENDPASVGRFMSRT